MTTDRTARAEDPAVLSVHFASATPAQSSEDTTASNPATADSTTATTQPTERVSTIDMKHRTNAEILEELVRMTRAQAVEATEAEREELRALEEQRVKGAKDSAKSLEVRARVAREKQLLEQARGELAADAV